MTSEQFILPASNEIKTALVVLAHPADQSLSHSIATRVASKLSADGISVEIADLHQEGFASAMTLADIELYRGKGELPPDIAREQSRIERADLLVVVFPVFWWSVPALLKGWFERVFTGGWAYESGSDGTIVGRLRQVPVRLIATAASGAESFDRHGYAQSIRTQIVHGIFGFLGLKDAQLRILFDADSTSPERVEAFVGELAPVLSGPAMAG